jgi:hypothetical protein
LKRILIYSTLFLIAALLAAGFYFYLTPSIYEHILRKRFDLSNNQPVVNSKQDIDSILQSIPQQPFQNLEDSYKVSSGYEGAKYRKLVNGKKFYLLKQEDFFKKIVGHHRVIDFICKDKHYRACLYDKDKTYPWLMDKSLLYALLDLKTELKKVDCNPDGFVIRSGHRHPKRNEWVGGASMSRHMYGEALDLRIQDINNDGKYSDEDKQIVLNILDKKVIGNKGGVGLYPGTRAVHMDVRGRRARWDLY